MSAALTRFHFFQTGNAHSPPWQTFLPAVRSFGHFALFLFSDRSNHFTYRQLTRSSLRCPVLDARTSRSRKKQSTFVNCFSLKTGNVLFLQATERKKHPSISICFQLLLFLSSSGRFSFFFFLMFLRQCSRLRISLRYRIFPCG